MSLLYRKILSNGVSKVSVSVSPRKEGNEQELTAEISPASVAIPGIWIEAQYYTLLFSSKLEKLLPPAWKGKKSLSILWCQHAGHNWFSLILNCSFMMFYIFKVS